MRSLTFRRYLNIRMRIHLGFNCKKWVFKLEIFSRAKKSEAEIPYHHSLQTTTKTISEVSLLW